MNKNIKLGLIVAGLFLLSIVAPLAAMPTKAQTTDTITVAVDLSHGESDKYLDYIMSNITFVNWVVFDGQNLSITPENLSNVDVLILGQPTVGFSPDEMDAIYNWLVSGNKVLWVAGDSDYGSGWQTQEYVNDLLEYIGAKLRIEYASFYDDYHNCQRFYRVLVHMAVDDYPELETSIISQNITKPILAHGPAPLIWVDDTGTPHDITNETFPGLIRILWSYDTAYIGDNNPPAPMLYDPLFYGQGSGNHTFVFLAAEYWEDVHSLVVVSGESPYGDYEPGFAWEYYGVQLDGPQYVTNMITWFNTLILQIWPSMETTTTTTETTTTTTQTTTTTTEETTTTTTQEQTSTTTTTTTEQTTTTTTGQQTTEETTTTEQTTEEGGINTGLLVAVVVIIIIIIAGAFALRK
ncbi:MAG: GldG family protein [Desulfurococcales archaeon]|nr:GldG family protein [Desulfurococcales archaeon]